MSGRRLRNALLALGTSLVALEAVLQVLALCVSWWSPSVARGVAGAGQTVVLCVGDSFTHGIGAQRDDGNYPSQMEVLLREQHPGRDWRVVNAGLAGQGSWDVLRRLDRQLVEVKPQVLCLLVGVNDRWLRPELHRLPDAPVLAADSFRLELRTLRLMRLVRELVATVIRGGTGTEPAAAGPADAAGLSGQGRFADAAAVWEQELLRRPGDPGILAALCEACARSGQRERAEQCLAQLRARHRAQPDQASAEALAETLARLGRNHAALDLAEQLLGEYPRSSALRQLIERLRVLIADWKTLGPNLTDRDEPLAGETEVARATRLWERANAVSSIDPLQSLQDVVRAFVLDPQPERALAVLRLVGSTYSRPMLEQCLLLVGGVPATTAHALRMLLAEARGGAAEPEPPPPERPDGVWLLGYVRLEVAPDAIAWGGIRLPVQFRDGRATGRLPSGQDFELAYERRVDTLYLTVSGAMQRAPLARWQVAAAAETRSAAPRDPSADMAVVLADHLRQIVARARRAGAAVVIGSYPYGVTETNAILQDVARVTGSVWVDVLPTFRELLKLHRPEDLYYRDRAHCSDEGYGVMARLMAAGVLRVVGDAPK